MGRISAKHVTGFFLAGAAIGAAAALLYAPKSGVQTRKDILKFSKKAVDRYGDLQDDVRERLKGRSHQEEMDGKGFEPSASALRTPRSPS